jgi:hypothetical protein
MDENRPDVNKTFRRPVDFFQQSERRRRNWTYPIPRPRSQFRADPATEADASAVTCARLGGSIWTGRLLLLHVRSIARTSSLCMYVLGTPGDETTVVLVYVWSIVFLFYQLDLTYVQLIHYWLWTLEGEIYRTRRRHGLPFGAVVFEAGRPGGRTTTATIIGEQRLANFCSS